MTPRQFYKTQPKDRVREVAERAGTTFENFKQIAIAGGSVSSRLAKALADTSDGEMSILEILFPNDTDEAAEQALAKERDKVQLLTDLLRGRAAS